MSDVLRLNSSYRAAIAEFLRGDQLATDFICRIFSVLHIWDDLIDKDKSVSQDEIHGAFWTALIDLPANSFYQRHIAALHPILVAAILNWQAANSFEELVEDSLAPESIRQKQLSIAFILRGTYIDLLSMAAFLVGGYEWAAQVVPKIRTWAHAETFSEYLISLKLEAEARRNV